jgi:hypothetical protein
MQAKGGFNKLQQLFFFSAATVPKRFVRRMNKKRTVFYIPIHAA